MFLLNSVKALVLIQRFTLFFRNSSYNYGNQVWSKHFMSVILITLCVTHRERVGPISICNHIMVFLFIYLKKLLNRIYHLSRKEHVKINNRRSCTTWGLVINVRKRSSWFNCQLVNFNSTSIRLLVVMCRFHSIVSYTRNKKLKLWKGYLVCHNWQNLSACIPSSGMTINLC